LIFAAEKCLTIKTNGVSFNSVNQNLNLSTLRSAATEDGLLTNALLTGAAVGF
jgi:hypothetical protein